jgi:CubicO group peptidase (beta-lactamase class C family)
MIRRDFLRSTLAAASMPNLIKAIQGKEDAINVAGNLIQEQVDAGVINAATFYLRLGDRVEQRRFGQAQSMDAMFLLGSITKPMAITGVMTLVDEGEIHLSDKVVKYLPEFSEGDRKEVTVRHLLTHTSGLPDQLPENADLRKRHAPLSEFVVRAMRTPLLFKPGTRYNYQSMGILLATEIAQRITGKTIHALLSDRVYSPLGMTRSSLGLGSFQTSDIVPSQMEGAAPESGAGSEEAKNWDWNSPYWRNLGAPWGGGYSSADDVARFLESFLHPDGRVVKESTARQMIRNHNKDLDTPRGLGFAVGPGGFGQGCFERTFGHGGSTGTVAWADPENDRVCVILTSLPARVSRALVLHPVGDLISVA